MGKQQLDRAGFAFFRKQPHRNSWNQKEVEPRRKIEKSVNIGISSLQHIKLTRENPKEQTSEQQKDSDDYISHRRGKKITKLFFKQRKHNTPLFLF
jgi:hypothetical protein